MSNNNIDHVSKSLEEHYLEKDYSGASELLLENKKHFPAAKFHYNLGTLHLKMGQLGAGRYNFEKSLKLGNTDLKLQHNLKIIKQRLGESDWVSESSTIDKVIDYSLIVPQQIFTSMTLTFLILTVLMFKFKLIINKITISVLILFACIPFGYSTFYLNKLNTAIAMKEISLKEGPSDIYPEVLAIPEGVKLILGESNNGWFLIKHPKQIVGWVKKDNLGFY